MLSLEAITPIFLLLSFGYLLKRFQVAGEAAFDAANKLCFKVFLPVLLFYNIYRTELHQVLNGKLILFTVICVLCEFVLGYLAVLKLSSDNAKRGVMLQGFFRSNFAILGVLIVEYVCGDRATGLASLMVAVVVPLFNVLAVVCLERFRNGRLQVGVLLKGILTNPLIWGCALGTFCLLCGIRLPAMAEDAVADVAGVALPLSMIALGASFTFSSVKGYWRELSVTVAAKLVIVPAVVLLLAVAFGFRGEALACILVTFGAPVAVSSFSMAQEMGGDGTLAAQIVVVTSACCLVTLFGWIFLLSYFGLF